MYYYRVFVRICLLANGNESFRFFTCTDATTVDRRMGPHREHRAAQQAGAAADSAVDQIFRIP